MGKSVWSRSVALFLVMGHLFCLFHVGCDSQQDDRTDLPVVQRVGLNELEEVIGSKRGDVVLLDIWATWCAPCVEAWPKLLELDESYGDRGLSIVTLSVDSVEAEEGVVEFLGERGMPGEALILDVENYNDFVGQLDSEWEGGVPAMLLYDRNGNLRYEGVGVDAGEGLGEELLKLLEDE